MASSQSSLPMRNPERFKPKPSLLEQTAMSLWLFVFPVVLMYSLYRFRKSYTTHTAMYVISCISVTLYMLFHMLVMVGMYGGGAFS